MTMQAHPTLQQDAGWWSPGSEVARWETDSMTTEHLTLRAEMSSVRVLRQELLRLCRDHGVDVDAAGDLVLAVSEAFTNAVRHGTSTAGSLIEASIRVSPSGCHVALCYLGEPFEAPPARLPDCHATGGRGRYLMDVLVDRVQYRFRDGITEIELHKNWL